jgi:hypothetical protein
MHGDHAFHTHLNSFTYVRAVCLPISRASWLQGRAGDDQMSLFSIFLFILGTFFFWKEQESHV